MPYFQRPSPGLPLALMRSSLAEGAQGGSRDSGVAPAGDESDIVQQAMSILERETSPGVPALTGSSPGPTTLSSPSQPWSQPMNSDQVEARADQLRRQASDLVEGLLSLVMGAGAPLPYFSGASGASGGSGAGRFPGQASPPLSITSADWSGAEVAPILKPTTTETVKAGEVARISVTVDNSGEAPVDVRFYSSDLVGDSGFGVPARKVAITPRSQAIPPHQRGSFTIDIPVPAQTPAGTYAGLLRATGIDGLRAVLTVSVE